MTILFPRIKREIAPNPNPTAAVMWLHGQSAESNNFTAIVPELKLRAPVFRTHGTQDPVVVLGEVQRAA